VLLNSSRGAVFSSEALRVAVGRGRGGFVIDTWNDEPRIDRAVLEGVLLGTPHIAGYSQQGKAAGTAMVVNALGDRFGLPLRDWFPAGVGHSEPREISWEEMCRTMPSRFDIAAESAALKAAPDRFEAMRNNYDYRLEYF
jgi:erythronate-4-phosphate dehydrogenase